MQRRGGGVKDLGSDKNRTFICGISYFTVTITTIHFFPHYIKITTNKEEKREQHKKKQIVQRYCTSKLKEAFARFHVCFFWYLTVLSPISHRQEIEEANKIN